MAPPSEQRPRLRARPLFFNVQQCNKSCHSRVKSLILRRSLRTWRALNPLLKFFEWRESLHQCTRIRDQRGWREHSSGRQVD